MATEAAAAVTPGEEAGAPGTTAPSIVEAPPAAVPAAEGRAATGLAAAAEAGARVGAGATTAPGTTAEIGPGTGGVRAGLVTAPTAGMTAETADRADQAAGVKSQYRVENNTIQSLTMSPQLFVFIS